MLSILKRDHVNLAIHLLYFKLRRVLYSLGKYLLREAGVANKGTRSLNFSAGSVKHKEYLLSIAPSHLMEKVDIWLCHQVAGI